MSIFCAQFNFRGYSLLYIKIFDCANKAFCDTTADIHIVIFVNRGVIICKGKLMMETEQFYFKFDLTYLKIKVGPSHISNCISTIWEAYNWNLYF